MKLHLHAYNYYTSDNKFLQCQLIYTVDTINLYLPCQFFLHDVIHTSRKPSEMTYKINSLFIDTYKKLTTALSQSQ